MSQVLNLASRMNKQITIQSPTMTANGAGGFATSWNTFATVWAEITQATGKEIFDADHVEEVQNVIFTIRYLDGITPAMRIQFCSDYYNIRSIINAGLKNEMLEIVGERMDI